MKKNKPMKERITRKTSTKEKRMDDNDRCEKKTNKQPHKN